MVIAAKVVRDTSASKSSRLLQPCMPIVTHAQKKKASSNDSAPKPGESSTKNSSSLRETHRSSHTSSPTRRGPATARGL